MSIFLKGIELITGCAFVSYLTLTGMMQDPDKPYRGHLNIIRSGIFTKNIHPTTETLENIDVGTGSSN